MKTALINDIILTCQVCGIHQNSNSLGKNLVSSEHMVDIFHFVDKDQKIISPNELNNFYTFRKVQKKHLCKYFYFFENSILKN